MPKRRWSVKKIPTHLQFVMVVFLMVVCASVIGVIGTHGNVSDAITLATTHQPERYTQLFFDNPAKLPSYAPTGKIQTLNFSIVNNNAEQVTYTYETTITIGSSTTSTSHSLTLANGQSAQLVTQFTVPTPLTKAQITIHLLGTNQRITLASTS